ncbi:MAG: CatB-related O-acetyltransferase [Bacilli bacterium]|nr:CatB-related O-acetyltransferase [Bacilli bacterium]
MKKFPNKNAVIPNKVNPSVCFVKNLIKDPRIKIGDYTYYDGVKTTEDFMKHVQHFYSFSKDKLIIGKFCQIASGVNFIMNNANHRMNCVTTYPFYIMGGNGNWGGNMAPHESELPNKGNIVIGNDVWIGQNVTIMPGVHIGDGAIIGLNATVAKDIPPYSIAVGNPAHVVKKRFDNEMIKLLEQLKWWDKPINEIDKLIPLLTNSNLKQVKTKLKKLIK